MLSSHISTARKKWIFDGTRLHEGPVRVSPGPDGYPLTVYAALYNKLDGMTYLFKGSKVWLYDELTGTVERSSLKKKFKDLHSTVRVNSAFMFYGKFLFWGINVLDSR